MQYLQKLCYFKDPNKQPDPKKHQGKLKKFKKRPYPTGSTLSLKGNIRLVQKGYLNLVTQVADSPIGHPGAHNVMIY